MKRQSQQLALLTRRLADLANGGLTLNRSLDILGGQSQNKQMSSILHGLKSDLQSGKSFSQALLGQNSFFPPLYVGMIQTGESAGNLEASFDELAQWLESDLETSQRLRTALAYPIILLMMAVAVCFFLTAVVIPRFEFLFQDLGQSLPLPTRLLIGFTVFFKKAGWVLLAGISFGAVTLFKKRPDLFDRVMDWPLVRDIIQGAVLQRWTQTMASLLRGGFTVADALRLSRQTISNRFYSDQLGLVLIQVLEGRSLSAALSSSGAFPVLLFELVAAAEESGRLETVFARLALSYRRETEHHLKLALSLLEPALILGMGGVVGFVALAMLLPIFSMSAGIR